MTWKSILGSWVWLLILTLVSVALGKYLHLLHSNKVFFIASVMLIVALKGQQIVDIFMELKHAPKNWRYLLMSYIIILPTVITLIYL